MRIPEAGSTYGDTPPYLGMSSFILINYYHRNMTSIAGRGYYTAITGYKNDDHSIGGIYVHVSDDGWDKQGFIGIVILIIIINIIMTSSSLDATS